MDTDGWMKLARREEKIGGIHFRGEKGWEKEETEVALRPSVSLFRKYRLINEPVIGTTYP